MEKVKYLILGGGPSGLTLGRCLKDRGESDFLIIEKEKEPGGLCRSVEVDGSPLDMGGGHFLDTRRPLVDEFVFRFLPKDEWNTFERDSRISIHDTYISHPFEANIWQLPEEYHSRYLESIRLAGCNNGVERPTFFTRWIRWKLGDEIADNYMLPYNRKIFSDELDELGTYWLEKLPSVSYEQTLQSCREHKSFGTQPGHAQFFYPKKYGMGEVFLRIADSISDNVILGTKVINVDLENRVVTCDDGKEYCAECIITSIPWTSFEVCKAPAEFYEALTGLKHTSLEIRYAPDNHETKAHWVYVPDERVPFHRILCRSNFIPGARGMWFETNLDRVGLFEESGSRDTFSYVNEYAYPLNTVNKPASIAKILEIASNRNVIGLGRWGEHEHYNCDLVMERAMKLAERLI